MTNARLRGWFEERITITEDTVMFSTKSLAKRGSWESRAQATIGPRKHAQNCQSLTNGIAGFNFSSVYLYGIKSEFRFEVRHIFFGPPRCGPFRSLRNTRSGVFKSQEVQQQGQNNFIIFSLSERPLFIFLNVCVK